MDFICRECGKKYTQTTVDYLIDLGKFYCFDCAFWIDRLQYVDDPNHVIIDGHYFVVGSGNSNGMGGREHRIIRNDGREITTSDLWHNGRIDDRFKDRLKDNAVFGKVVKHHVIPDDCPF